MDKVQRIILCQRGRGVLFHTRVELVTTVWAPNSKYCPFWESYNIAV